MPTPDPGARGLPFVRRAASDGSGITFAETADAERRPRPTVGGNRLRLNRAMVHAASHPDDFERSRDARARHHVLFAWTAALLALAIALVPANAAAAGVAIQTVCTITVNSADEKEALRRHLPADRFRFVELVEKGRPDWLASARKQNLRCDVLVISGHFDGGIDGGNEFFSEQVEAREFLPVAEMERASCSADDHGIFANLKEVYLFGCNTLNPESFRNGVGEIERSLMRSGQTRADAARSARALALRHGDGSRDRMRQIFPDVPAIYGFSSVAPLGPAAGSLLAGYLKAGGAAEFGSGRQSQRLLAHFGKTSLAVASGIRAGDPLVPHRQDICGFTDERRSTAEKLAFAQNVLARDPTEVRLFLNRLEALEGELTAEEREAPQVQEALRAIAADEPSRDRFLAFARDTEQPSVRARMVGLARQLGWLDDDGEIAEQMAMIDARLAAPDLGVPDVDLVCSLNDDRRLDTEIVRLDSTRWRPRTVAQSGVLACLGDRERRAAMREALISQREEDVRIAQVYYRYRPVDDPSELRAIATGIGRIRDADTQVRALNTLGAHRLSDPVTLEALARLFPSAETAGVQSAIAGVLIRANYHVLERSDLLNTLTQHQLRASGQTLVDVLIRRLRQQ